MSKILERLVELFSPVRIAQYLAGDLLPRLVAGIAAFLAFYVAYRLVDRGLGALLARTHLDKTARSFIQSVVRYGILTIGVVTALAQFGIDVASLLTSLGVAGLTIGFAAKDVLSNLLSGIFIFWDRPFVVGDLVEVGGQYGRVEEITMRTTRVVTVDGKMLAIPNATVVGGVVASYTNFPNLRLDLDFTVGVEEDLGRVRELLLQLVRDDARFMKSPEAVVVVTSLNDYNVAMQLRVWLVDERTHVRERVELRERLFLALREAGVHMPYQTLEVHTARAA